MGGIHVVPGRFLLAKNLSKRVFGDIVVGIGSEIITST
jgi:hypothetical protein